MSTLTTAWFRSHYTSINWASSPTIGAVFFARTPDFNADTTTLFDTFTTLTSLTSRVEWVPIKSTATFTQGGTPVTPKMAPFLSGPITGLRMKTVSGPSVIDDPVSPTGWTFAPVGPATSVQEVLSAVVFYLVDATGSTYGGGINPIMFATTSGIGEGTVIHDGAIYGEFALPVSITGGNPHSLAVDTTAVPWEYASAFLRLSPAPPAWEGAHAQHIWLEPQRVNLLVNPSFENVSLSGWRWSSTPLPPPWTPTSVLGGLRGWWDPSNAGSITASSGRVSQWNDLSGLGHHFTQGTPGQQPLTGSTTLNSLNAIQFTRTRPDMMGSLVAPGAAPYIVYMVVKLDVPSTVFQMIFDRGSGTGASFGAWNSAHSMIGNEINPDLDSGVAFPSGHNQFTLIYDGAASKIIQNGTVLITGTATTAAMTGMVIGARAINDAGMTGAIAEFFVATGNTRDTTAETYLKTKWGTP